MISLIAALDEQGGIGVDNALPWKLSKDLQRFKRLTLGHPIIMGRKTADSLPAALKERNNIVLTRSKTWSRPGFEIAADLDAVLRSIKNSGDRWFVIGGGEIYQAFLPYADRMHLTHVSTIVIGADAFFPKIDPGQWMVTHREAHPQDEKNEFNFEFVDYERKI
jgi:dihydrofolate reductase